MVKVSIEVRSGAAHFDVGVQAESIQRAMCFVRERYPMGEGRASFTIEPDSFFVEDIAARAEQIECEEPQKKTAA
jgi:hypothetical protein